MDDQNSPLPSGTVSDSRDSGPSAEELRQQRRTIIIFASIAIAALLAVVVFLFILLLPSTSQDYVSRIRDVFIIVMALESLLIGVVLVILMLQLARLTNLLQHEIKPILDSTNETISTLRGTTAFLSDNLAEPVIKLNEYVAALQRLLELVGIGRRNL